VNEGADKPQSDPAWARQNCDIVNVAHWGIATDESISDFDGALNVFRDEFVNGLIAAETTYLVGQLYDDAALTSSAGGLGNALDSLLSGLNDLRTGSAYTAADAIIMHPDDYLMVRTLKADTSGEYLSGSPIDPRPLQVDGVPVYQATQVPEGYPLVGNFALACRLYVREGPRFEVNAQGGEDEWKANKVLLRAEERIGLATVYPNALSVVNLGS